VHFDAVLTGIKHGQSLEALWHRQSLEVLGHGQSPVALWHGEHRSHPEKAQSCLESRVLDIQCVHCRPIEVHCIVSYLLVLVHFVYFMPILCSINVPNNYCYGYTCSYYVITISQHHDNILRRDDDGIFSRHQTARRDYRKLPISALSFAWFLRSSGVFLFLLCCMLRPVYASRFIDESVIAISLRAVFRVVD